MPELLRVREGSPPYNIITERTVSLHEIVALFGSNPEGYTKHQSSKLLHFEMNKYHKSGVAEKRHVVIIIKEEEVEPKTFPEAGC